MDFLRSNPNLSFQKKNSKPPGPGDFDVQKIGFIQMRCDMSLTNITKITFSGTYTNLQRKMPLGNALLEFLILLH